MIGQEMNTWTKPEITQLTMATDAENATVKNHPFEVYEPYHPHFPGSWGPS